MSLACDQIHTANRQGEEARKPRGIKNPTCNPVCELLAHPASRQFRPGWLSRSPVVSSVSEDDSVRHVSREGKLQARNLTDPYEKRKKATLLRAAAHVRRPVGAASTRDDRDQREIGSRGAEKTRKPSLAIFTQVFTVSTLRTSDSSMYVKVYS